MEYKIISHQNAEDTVDEVNALLKEGWVLHGDLRVTDSAYSQALTKSEYYGGVDSSVFVTIDELDGIRYAIEAIGGAIENLVGALGHVAAAGLSDKPEPEVKKEVPKLKRKSSRKKTV
jgi:hypothetical protein